MGRSARIWLTAALALAMIVGQLPSAALAQNAPTGAASGTAALLTGGAGRLTSANEVPPIRLGQVAPAQPNPAAGNNCGGCTLFQGQTDPASPGYAAPTDGVITSWSVQGPSDGCSTCVVRLRIFRPTGPGQFLTVADSADQIVAAGLNTFGSNIAVRSGDRLGIRATDGIRWYAGNSGDQIAFVAGDPAPGATTTQQGSCTTPSCWFTGANGNGSLTNVAATLRPGDAISGIARCGEAIANSVTLRSGGVAVGSRSGLEGGAFSFAGTAPLTTYTLDYQQWTVTLDRLVLAFSCSVSVTTDPYGNASAPGGAPIRDLGNHSFPKAYPLTNGAGQADYMAVAGRPNWYKISIAPGQRLSVTVRGAAGGALPADLVLTLFGDIPVRQAADHSALTGSGDPLALLRRSDAGVAPDGLSPDGLSPDGLSPDGLSPDGLSPDGLSPDGLSPDGLSPDGLSPDGLSPDGLSPDGLSPDGLSPDGLSSLYTSAQTESLLRVSDKPGTEPEAVLQNTWSNSGTYYIRVRGHNGAFSASDPYTVTATLAPASCANVVLQSTYVPTTVATAGGFRSIIITNTGRLGPGTAALGASAGGALRQTLNTFAARPEVAGVVVDLAADTGVGGAYAQWDATTDSRTCPAAANIVASTIKSIVNAYAGLNPGVHYVVIAGGDAVVPYLRVPDQAGLGNESLYQPPVASNTPSDASLRFGYTLTDGFYGSTTPISRFDHLLYLMDHPVGRLVESPADITAMIAAYTGGYDALANGDVIKPTSALVTGYDFLADTAQFIAGQWASSDLTVDQSLISTSWSASDLAKLLLDPLHKPSYGLVNLNGHFSANTALAADFATRLRTSDFAPFTDGRFTNMLVVSSGCHSGYNIVDDQIVPNLTQPLDWPQLFNGKGATLIGGTGYQYGDTDFRKYTELILSNFAQELRYGTGPVAVGDALASAKRTYLSQVATLSGTDEKALVESTLYGVPMFTVDLPLASRTSRPADGSSVSLTAGASSGLSVATVAPAYTVHQVDKTMTGGQVASYNDASYGVVQHDVQATPGSQILPRVVQNVHANGFAARGVILDHATFTNSSTTFLPLTDNATIETSGSRAYFTAPVMTPVTPFGLNTYDSENLILTPAQFRSTTVGATTGVERTLGAQTLRIYYSSRTDAAALAAAPVIYTVNVNANADPAKVDVNVTIGGSVDPGVETAVATYTLDENAPSGAWNSLDLVAGADTSNDVYHFVRHYTGTITSGPAGTQAVRLFIQAVGGNALVSRATNNGAFYALVAPAAPTVSAPLRNTSLALSAPSSAAYRDRIALTATLTDADGFGVAGKTVTFAFDGTAPTTTSAVTGASGAVTTYLRTGSLPGTYSVAAAFDGDTTYLGSAARRPITVTRAPTTLSASVPAVTAITYSETAVVATLASGGRPLGLLPLGIILNGVTIPGSTDGYGRVRINTLDPVVAGSNSYAITFSGSELYVAASLQGSFTLVPAAATVTGVALPPQPTGVPITLSATVQEVPDNTPGDLTKAQVTFVLLNTDTQSTVTVSGAVVNGVAKVTVPAQPSGLYSVRTTVGGGFYGSSTTSVPLVVYDPSTFVIGGGWVLTTAATPVAASVPLPAGKKAIFGFIVRYKDGATVPTGNLLFQLSSASIDLKATSFDWLVTSTGHAAFQGHATINGKGSFGYRVTADSASGGAHFEIRIWDPAIGGAFDQPMYIVSNVLGGGIIKLH